MPASPPPFQRTFHPHENDQRLWSALLAFIDIVIICIAARLNYSYVYSDTDVTLLYTMGTGVFIFFILITSHIYSVYQCWETAPLSREIKAIFTAWIVATCFLTLLGFIFKANTSFSRVWFASTLTSAIILIIFSRIIFRQFLSRTKGSDWNKINIIIIGAQQHGQTTARKISAAQWPNISIKGFFDDNFDVDKTSDIKFLGNIEQLEPYLKHACNQDTSIAHADYIHQAWITLSTEHPNKEKLISILDKFSLDTIYIPEPYFQPNKKQNLTSIAGIPVITLSAASFRTRQRVIKSLEDIILSSIILLIISPIMLLIAIGVKLTSPGPVFFRQKRLTLSGKSFQILKFRSMPIDIEKHTGPVEPYNGDRRATKFGHFLRHTSLDELPQFINVLKGEMSIVGPRPERPIFVEKHTKDIPNYMKKHLLKAGITGWAQINGYRGDTDIKKRIELDLHYIENWSLMFDFKIIFKTLYKGFIN